MIRGWYTGASGMNAQQNRLDAISNNLANVDTAGYKRDVTVSKSFPELLIRRTDFDGVYKIPNGMGSADAAPIIGKLGLGVETNLTTQTIIRGKGKNVKANREKIKNIPNYRTIRCMRNAMLASKEAYRTLIAAM